MRFILKVDKEDCFKVAELKEITAVELLIINKALHLLSQNEEVAERDRYVAEKLGAELMRKDAVQRPLTAIDGADIADTPQTDAEIPKNALRSDCTGCRFVGTYDTEFPCANCIRKNKDYYTSEQTDCPWK